MRKSLLSQLTAIALLAAAPAIADDAGSPDKDAKSGKSAALQQNKEKETDVKEAPAETAETENGGGESGENVEPDQTTAEQAPSAPFYLDASEYIMSLSASDRDHLITDWGRYRYSETMDQISYIHYEPAVPQPAGTFLFFPEWGGTDRLTGFALMVSDEKWDSYIFLPTPDLNSMRPSGNYSEEYLSKSAKAYTDYVRDACATAESNGGKVIIAVSGRSAPWLLSMLRTGLLDSPAALVLINAQYPDEKTAGEMAVTVAGLNYHVLDLIIGPEIGWLKSSAVARSHEAGKKGSRYYRQARTGTSEEAERKLRGWLKKNIGR